MKKSVKKENPIDGLRNIYEIFSDIWQSSKKEPDNPEYIHRKAKQIRKRIAEEKRIARDLELIKYDSQIRERKISLLSWIINKIRKSRRKKTFSKKNLEEMK
jgi:hypothetical protein